jgi:hypothetical protein
MIMGWRIRVPPDREENANEFGCEAVATQHHSPLGFVQYLMQRYIVALPVLYAVLMGFMVHYESDSGSGQKPTQRSDV